MNKLLAVYRDRVPLSLRKRIRSTLNTIKRVPELLPARTLRRRGYRRQGLAGIAADGLRLVQENERVYAYQPLWRVEELTGARALRATERTCHDRWIVMEPHLPKHGSFMDVGSQNGYFVFQAAAHGLTAQGVERDPVAHKLATLLALGHGVERATFIRMDVTPDTVGNLPTVDCISCMSVFHHWVRNASLEVATAVMKGLAARCTSTLFFETGQNNEAGAWWAHHLDFMGDDPELWTSNYLKFLGFSRVVNLGRFAADHVAGVPRTLFVATKSA